MDVGGTQVKQLWSVDKNTGEVRVLKTVKVPKTKSGYGSGSQTQDLIRLLNAAKAELNEILSVKGVESPLGGIDASKLDELRTKDPEAYNRVVFLLNQIKEINDRLQSSVGLPKYTPPKPQKLTPADQLLKSMLEQSNE